MKILIGLVLLITLFACEKEQNFECTQTITTQRKGSTCGPNELVLIGGFTMTYDEKWDLEHQLTYSQWTVINKDSVWLESKYHCIPAYCK